MGMHIVATGNPVEGFRFYGPFTTGDEAIEWATANANDDWWIAPLREGKP